MRTTGRLTPISCGLVMLVAAMGVVALAQGRGAPGATNSFHRFNYSLDEMQPIAYPAQPIVTQHQITLQRETIKYTALSLIHISEPTRLGMISYAVFCLKK